MPQPLDHHEGKAVILKADNIDTDQIIPSREMKSVSREGLGQGLFAGWRYKTPEKREPNEGFVLNRPEAAGATILVSGRNFGCGSSREHAVWALAEYGFRAIIAESFGAIFYGNCLRNGILPIVLQDPASVPPWQGTPTVRVDLPAQRVTRADAPGWEGRFDIDAYPKTLLMEGLEPIDLTLRQDEAVERFLAEDRRLRPWIYSAA
jgi:3-isopropylmalate/(R)-2-methylmalate dehydratase small subunit